MWTSSVRAEKGTHGESDRVPPSRTQLKFRVITTCARTPGMPA